MGESEKKTPRDAGNWAAKVDRLEVTDEIRKYGYNIDGMRVAGPHQGFGRLWQRVYTASLGDAVTPEALIARWRADFAAFWPKGSTFHGKLTGIAPGDVAALQAGPMTTGILVLYADETSFTFMTPEGHVFAGMITFSGETAADGGTVARIVILLRTSDPLFEAGWGYIRGAEDAFWRGTLANLAAVHGVPDAAIEDATECLDPKRIWKHWTNVFRNAGLRTLWHTVTTPFQRRTA